MDNQLAYMDQASFLARRALGHEPLQQFVFLYDHDVNMDRLREFHRNLGYTLLGRRIERSPLAFGRDRWVAAPHQADLEVSSPRPRSEYMAWIDEQATVPIDPELGPAWRMAVLPFTDGGAAIAIVVSHSTADVGGVILSVTAALEGNKIDLGYPRVRSRTGRRALREDLKALRRSAPDIRAAFKAARELNQEERPGGTPRPRPAKHRSSATVLRPAVFAVVAESDWDARARELSGNGAVLVAAFAARLGLIMGQARPDGSVVLNFPVNQRGDADYRANALTGMSVTADPETVLTKLGPLKIGLVRGLRGIRTQESKELAAVPLAPVTPKWLVRRLAGLASGDGPVVGCTNMGDVPEKLISIDGTPAEYVLARGVECPVNADGLDAIGDWLLVGSGRLSGNVVLYVTSWQVGAKNSRDELAAFILKALDDFCLTATFV